MVKFSLLASESPNKLKKVSWFTTATSTILGVSVAGSNIERLASLLEESEFKDAKSKT